MSLVACCPTCSKSIHCPGTTGTLLARQEDTPQRTGNFWQVTGDAAQLERECIAAGLSWPNSVLGGGQRGYIGVAHTKRLDKAPTVAYQEKPRQSKQSPAIFDQASTTLY